jgi:hypothetical protein
MGFSSCFNILLIKLQKWIKIKKIIQAVKNNRINNKCITQQTVEDKVVIIHLSNSTLSSLTTLQLEINILPSSINNSPK